MISYTFAYYGEMITYLGMTAPIAAAAAVSWIKHPFKSSREVEIHHLTRTQLLWLIAAAALATVLFYFILKALGNANLFWSTFSVTTSFVAASLTFLRSPYYALDYAANDVVLIVLWIIAAAGDPAALAMVACFAAFLANDLYGFFNWKRMEKRQCA